jgi:hypothetical protein
MISLPHPARVFLHAPATDLRKGFDALSGLVTTAFAQNPTSGHLFLFVNRRRDRIKILKLGRKKGIRYSLSIWADEMAGAARFNSGRKDGPYPWHPLNRPYIIF